VVTHVTGTVHLPASSSCISPGFPCSMAQMGVQEFFPGATCVTPAGGGCDCNVSTTDTLEDTATAYTDANGTVTISVTDGGTFATCVNPPGTLKLTRTDGQAPLETGQLTLTQQ
jgi:hypothetical protein